jgi:hypothetical protein
MKTENINKLKEMKTKVKKYQIILTESDKGYSIDRINDGFNVFELMGLLEHTQIEIMQQMAGKIKPTRVKRTVITE